MMRLMIVLSVLFAFAVTAFAAGPNTYQVTGPILEIKGDVIVVQKGKEKWEVAKDAATKINGELKVGAKVTIQYTMKATSIEVKEEGKKADSKKNKAEPAKK